MDAIDLVVQIHPVALFTIVGGYERRPDKPDSSKTTPQKRIIGTVLGSRERNYLEVKTAFTVPHNETLDEVRILINVSSVIAYSSFQWKSLRDLIWPMHPMLCCACLSKLLFVPLVFTSIAHHCNIRLLLQYS